MNTKEYNHQYYLNYRERIKQGVKTYAKLNPEKIKEQDYGNIKRWNKTVKGKWSNVRSRSKFQKRVCNLTLSQMESLISEGCFYCGKNLLEETGYSLDRIDNSQDYTFANVLPCCSKCNHTRGENHSVDEIQVMILALLEYQDKEK